GRRGEKEKLRIRPKLARGGKKKIFLRLCRRNEKYIFFYPAGKKAKLEGKGWGKGEASAPKKAKVGIPAIG
ncbi:MAG: hypothetical protein ACK4WK_00975, partial [Anaerolineae bacterium]